MIITDYKDIIRAKNKKRTNPKKEKNTIRVTSKNPPTIINLTDSQDINYTN